MLNPDFDFKNLFVLDVANNHQGQLEHGLRIIRECAKAAKEAEIRAAVKFQYRDLSSFVHKDHRNGSGNKHVGRFLGTRLNWDQYEILVNEVRQNSLLSICTPFDEESVRKIAEHKFDVIKIASCSADDWPLLECVAETGLPVIASTGGLSIDKVDELVSFLAHKACNFALMHCVSIYPTPDFECNLRNITDFRRRYPGITIGWSTHESPTQNTNIVIAATAGAEIFERHVGVETPDIKLNAYSSTPEQLTNWFSAYKKTQEILGNFSRENISPLETESINSLRRGVYLKEGAAGGEILTRDSVYFAFPCQPDQLTSAEWCNGITLSENTAPEAPLLKGNIKIPARPREMILKKSIHEVKALLAYAKITLTHEFKTEYSHHYGIENFRKTGAVLITLINREYAKKIIVQLPGQSHPLHFHKLKEETFIVLWGSMISVLDGRKRELQPGDTLTVPPGVWHSFSTQEGCVFEEISTTAFPGDSVYRDPEINSKKVGDRKTIVDHWGRFQIVELAR